MEPIYLNNLDNMLHTVNVEGTEVQQQFDDLW